MKLLVFSDVHLDWVTHGVSRFEEIRTTMIGLAGMAIEENVDLVMFLGDFCDPDSGPVVYRAVNTMIGMAVSLREAGIKSLWIAGNHDVIEDGTGTTTLHPMQAIADDMVHVIQRPERIQLDGVTFVLLPFTATSHTYDPEEFAEGMLKDATGPTVVAGHLTVPGIVPGEETTDMPRGRDVRFPVEVTEGATLRLNGHYHRQQKSESGIWIPGSLARLTFGEQKHNPGYLVVEV